jgi:4-hydroxy-tetrahydrodipicolinate synthase
MSSISDFRGVYASTLTPFTAQDTIDEPRLAAHFRYVMEHAAMRGVLCNGHAGENFLLSRSETRRVVEIASESIGDRAIIAAGVLGEATSETVEKARDAAAAGAHAIVVFPPYSWAVASEPKMIVAHHQAVSDAVDLPIFLYMTSIWSGKMNYSPEVLDRLLRIRNVVAIKEGSWDTNAYERTRSLVARVAPHVAVMASGDAGLFPSFMVGTEGTMVSLAAIAPHLVVDLYESVRKGDFTRAQTLHNRLHQLAVAVYDTPPTVFATARLKVAMTILGHWPDARMRPPVGPLAESEVLAVRRALEDADLIARAPHDSRLASVR